MMRNKKIFLTGLLAVYIGIANIGFSIHANEPVQGIVETNTTNVTLPASDPYWSTFGGNTSGTGTIDGKTPTDLTKMEAKPNILPEQFFEPIIVGNNIFSITNCSNLTKYDADGNQIASVSLGATLTSWVSARMAYGDGKIFVAVNGRIKAYQADTLQPLWQSKDTKLQINGALIYHNGYLYAGATDGAFSNPKGYYFALNTFDEDSMNTSEEKEFAWKTPESKGYYWSSGAITGNAIVLAGDDGKLISHHLTKDITFDTYDLGENANVRSNLVYANDLGAVLMGTQKSKQFIKMPIKNDGTFDKQKLSSLSLPGEISGGLAYYQGRAYASSGGMSGNALQVIDVNAMKVAYSTSVNTQSYPLITTAYASLENNYKVYIYVIDFYGGLVKLEDAQDQTKEIKQEITKGYYGYNSNSILGDINGNLYIYNGFDSNGGNRITIYTNPDHAYTAEDVDRNLRKLQAQGMSYTNAAQFDHLQLQYQALSETEKMKVKELSVLEQLRKQSNAIVQAAISDIEVRIQNIPSIIATSDIPVLEQLWNDFGLLREADQKKVTGVDALKKAITYMYQIAGNVDQLVRDIASIDITKITLQDKVLLLRLNANYQALSKEDQVKVNNYDHLEKALDRLKQLEDETQVADLVKAIQSITTDITLDMETNITSLYKKYMELHKQVQPLVTNADVLINAYDEVMRQRMEVDQINDDIWGKVDPKNITLYDETLIMDIMKHYDALPMNNKKYIRYYDDVLQANSIITSLHNGVIPSIVFTNMKGLDQTYTYEGKFFQHPYQMMFHGLDIKQIMDMQVGFYNVSPLQDAIQKKMPNAYIMHMKQEGTLPGKLQIQAYVPLKNDSYKLYRYDKGTGQIMFIQDVSVIDHQVTYTIEQGGIYLIDMPVQNIVVDEPATSNGTPSTGDTTNMQVLVFMLGCSILGLFIIRRRYKKDMS